MIRRTTVWIVPLVWVAVATAALPALAGDADWPQWRGPLRNGHAADQELMRSWPDDGPQLKWQYSTAGTGYSECAVADGKLYTLGADPKQCFMVCLDAETGQQIWKTNFARAGVGDDYNQGWGGGPRGTPTIDGGQAFAISDIGILVAISIDDGSIDWMVDLVEDFGGKIPIWGYSESPLVDGDVVLASPGGAKFMVGLDRGTGNKVWASTGTDVPAHYVSAVKAMVGETSFYVTASKSGLLAFDAESGETLFSDTATGNDVAVIPTPIIEGNQIYHTSDYGAGNTLLTISETRPGQLNVRSEYHQNGKTMRNHHGGVVLVDGVIYGFTKVNRGAWMAQDFASGEVLWSEGIRPNRSGSIAYADGRLYCYNDKDGTCLLVNPNRDAFEVVGTLALPKQTDLPRDKGAIWAHPVIADQTLFIRDQDLIFAFDIAR